MSQSTPAARSAGPVTPQRTATSRSMTPTPAGPLLEDVVVEQQGVVFGQALLDGGRKASSSSIHSAGEVALHAPDADVVVEQPAAGEVIEQVQAALALSELVQEGREGTEVEAVDPDRHQVAEDPLHLGHDDADVLGALRHLEPAQALDGHAADVLVVNRREVVPSGPRRAATGSTGRSRRSSPTSGGGCRCGARGRARPRRRT